MLATRILIGSGKGKENPKSVLLASEHPFIHLKEFLILHLIIPAIIKKQKNDLFSQFSNTNYHDSKYKTSFSGNLNNSSNLAAIGQFSSVGSDPFRIAAPTTNFYKISIRSSTNS
ncbi:hypothetical protein Dimus_022049 [Dionaea muscipula]